MDGTKDQNQKKNTKNFIFHFINVSQTSWLEKTLFFSFVDMDDTDSTLLYYWTWVWAHFADYRKVNHIRSGVWKKKSMLCINSKKSRYLPGVQLCVSIITFLVLISHSFFSVYTIQRSRKRYISIRSELVPAYPIGNAIEFTKSSTQWRNTYAVRLYDSIIND